jgi:hypothetical protein
MQTPFKKTVIQAESLFLTQRQAAGNSGMADHFLMQFMLRLLG